MYILVNFAIISMKVKVKDMNYDICVFGGCALDSFYYKNELGEVPEVPSLIVPGGKGANQAVAASRAGAKVTIITKLGKDDKGQKILENLVYNGITTNNVELVEGLQNDCSNIIIDNITKDNEIIRFAGAIDSFTPDMIEKYKNVFLHSKIVVGQMKVPKEVSVELINFCYDNDIPIIITPCRPKRLSICDEGNKELIDKITYITANRSECETIFGIDNIEECVSKYPNKLIVTLGDDGIMYHNGIEIVRVPAVHTENVVDTTGAGDTFNGNFASFLSRGFNLREAIVKAQYASSMKIQVKGAQDGMPYEDELDKYIVNHLMQDNDYTREFDLAYNAILKANDKIKKKKILNVRVKEDETFVTESDLLIEKMIIDDITDQYPEDNFVTEEFNNKNTIKPFESLMMVLAGRIGVGSIAGIAISIYYGGIGSIFWMWISSILGASLTFVETYLGMLYQKKDTKNISKGGPSYYIKYGLNNKILGSIYAIIKIERGDNYAE